MDCSPPGFSVHGDFPGKNNGVGCHFLLQRIFPTQRLNPCLRHCRQILYCGAPGEAPPTRFCSLIFSSVCIDHLRLCLCFSQSTIKQIIFTMLKKRERLFTEVKGNMKWDEGAREWQLYGVMVTVGLKSQNEQKLFPEPLKLGPGKWGRWTGAVVTGCSHHQNLGTQTGEERPGHVSTKFSDLPHSPPRTLSGKPGWWTLNEAQRRQFYLSACWLQNRAEKDLC